MNFFFSPSLDFLYQILPSEHVVSQSRNREKFTDLLFSIPTK